MIHKFATCIGQQKNILLHITVLLAITATLFLISCNKYVIFENSNKSLFFGNNVNNADNCWYAGKSYTRYVQEYKKQNCAANNFKQNVGAYNNPCTSKDVTDKAYIAIVIDDGGEKLLLAEKAAELTIPLTFSIIPYRRNSVDTAKIAMLHDKPFMVHLPMQAISDNDDGPFLIGAKTNKSDISEITAKALDSLPGAIGLSNHRGSLATESKDIVEPVILELKKRNMVFVDSKTSWRTVAYDIAKNMNVSTLQNVLFLDNIQDREVIKKYFDEAIDIALKQHGAVVICHFKPETLAFLTQLNNTYESLPVKLITVPEMLKYKAGAVNK
jgi:polysaccharide deacetylase 2 family uncharacterized protein YibQ